LLLPTGSTTQRPSGTTPGRIRYNNVLGNVEVFQGSSWRALRYAESTTIVQQNLGAGDNSTTIFGPLNTAYNPTNVSYGTTLGGQNIIVLLENVFQVSGINYSVVQNPTIGAETYNAFLCTSAGSGSPTLYFNTSLNVTGASWASNVATLTVSNTSTSGFGYAAATGSTITVTGVLSSNVVGGISPYNGTFTVTGGTSTTITYALTTNPGTYYNSGTVTTTGSYPAVFPSINLNGATVTGTNIPSPVTLGSVVIVNTTYQFSCASTTLAVNQMVTISGTYGGTGSISGYANPTSYYIISTNGTTGFSLSKTPGGPAITVTAGTPTGLTYTLPVSVLSYTTDPNTNALTSISLSKNPSSTISILTDITIAGASETVSGYYLQFTSPVPYGKVVIALLGFDQ